MKELEGLMAKSGLTGTPREMLEAHLARSPQPPKKASYGEDVLEDERAQAKGKGVGSNAWDKSNVGVQLKRFTPFVFPPRGGDEEED